jgi:hypothetical protein
VPLDGSEHYTIGELWHRWATLVQLFARRRRGRRRLREREYRALHQELLRHCQALAEASEGESRSHYETLHALAQPWLTLQSLERADREVLIDLAVRCHAACKEPRTASRLPQLSAIARRGLAFVALAAAAGIVAGAGRRPWLRLHEYLTDLGRALRWLMAQPAQVWWWVAAGAAAAVVLGVAVVRAARA